MNIKFLSAAAFATATLVAAPAAAVTVIFDDFDDFQAVSDGPTATRPLTSDVISPPANFIGDSRTLTVENVTNNGQAEAATTLSAAGGALNFSNEAGATGIGTLTFDGVGDIQLDDDLSRSFIFFDITPGFDPTVFFSVTAIDTSDNSSTFSEVLTAGFSPFLFLSEFTGSADFNSLASLSFEINSAFIPDGEGGFFSVAQVDGSLNSISIGAVPLPASGLLLFGALGGVAAMRRRKNRKAA